MKGTTATDMTIAAFDQHTVLVAQGDALVAAAIISGVAASVAIIVFCHLKYVVAPRVRTFETLAESFNGECVQSSFKYPIVLFERGGTRFRVESSAQDRRSDDFLDGIRISADWADPSFRMSIQRKRLFSRLEQSFSGLKFASLPEPNFSSKFAVFLNKETDPQQLMSTQTQATLLLMNDNQLGLKKDAKRISRKQKYTDKYRRFDLKVEAGTIVLDCCADLCSAEAVRDLVKNFCDFYVLVAELSQQCQPSKPSV